MPDKLYKLHAGGFVNLFEQEWNDDLAPTNGGYSVSCIDYLANGRYAFLVTTYTKGRFTTCIFLTLKEITSQTD